MSKARLMQGNEACAEGAIAAGVNFFAGYPITPSTEIAETMAKLLPQHGGKFVQMEDEIASMGAILGASLAGSKVMDATSGPGFSLKQELIGYAACAEIPCVLVEMLLFLGGSIEVAAYAAQGSAAVGTNCLPILCRKPACLLANHGVVTTGTTLEQAYSNSIYVEDSAKIVRLAMSTGSPIPAIIDEEGSKPYHE